MVSSKKTILHASFRGLELLAIQNGGASLRLLLGCIPGLIAAAVEGCWRAFGPPAWRENPAGQRE
jgi:hypothetical protein